LRMAQKAHGALRLLPQELNRQKLPCSFFHCPAEENASRLAQGVR